VLRRVDEVILSIGATQAQAWLRQAGQSFWKPIAHADFARLPGAPLDAFLQALESIEMAIREATTGAAITIIPAQRICPALMIDFGPVALPRDARYSFVAHRFESVLGLEAGMWKFQYDARRRFGPAIAFALEHALLSALKARFSSPAYRLREIVPALAWLSKSELAQLKDSWVMDIDREGTTVVRIEGGTPSHIQFVPGQVINIDQLSGLFDRVLMLQGVVDDGLPVHVWSRGGQLETMDELRSGRRFSVRQFLPGLIEATR